MPSHPLVSRRRLRRTLRGVFHTAYRILASFSIMMAPYAATVNEATYIPDAAYQYIPLVKQEQRQYFPEIPQPAYFPALIEHESCISLTHKRCWNPASRLKSSREEGAGLGQITRTWNKDGSLRFDLIKEMRTQYRQALQDLEWSTIYSRPDLQIRSMILLARSNYRSLSSVPDPQERLNFSDLAYNAGLGRVYKDRRLCGLQRQCDPNRWFGQVEKTCTASQKALYGNRSACTISRHHVSDVIQQNLPKYRTLY